MNEKVDIEISRRRLTVEMEGLTQLEIISLGQMVDAKIEEVKRANDKVADTSKLAILAALELAAELTRLKDTHETTKRVTEMKVAELTHELRGALAQSGGA